MTGSNILLDTNIVIEIFDGNKEIADKVSKFSAIYISAVAVGELYVGVNRVSNKAKHSKKLEDFLQLCTILNVDETTAEYYGKVVAALYKKGKPIPTNDIWIAATAIQHNLTLATRDKHFNEVENLKFKAW